MERSFSLIRKHVNYSGNQKDDINTPTVRVPYSLVMPQKPHWFMLKQCNNSTFKYGPAFAGVVLEGLPNLGVTQLGVLPVSVSMGTVFDFAFSTMAAARTPEVAIREMAAAELNLFYEFMRSPVIEIDLTPVANNYAVEGRPFVGCNRATCKASALLAAMEFYETSHPALAGPLQLFMSQSNPADTLNVDVSVTVRAQSWVHVVPEAGKFRARLCLLARDFW